MLGQTVGETAAPTQNRQQMAGDMGGQAGGNFLYPLNAEGKPEFGSVVITLDHLLTARQDHHVVQKMVFSTESAGESLRSLMAYYNDDQSLVRPANLDLLLKNREHPDHTALLYTVPVQLATDRRGGLIVQVVLSTPAFGMILNHNEIGQGSSLLAINALVALVGQALDRIRNVAGAYPRLALIELSDEAAQNVTPKKAD